MYQLYAYLRSQERLDDPMSRHSTGVLLYPSLGVDYEESAIIQGHRVSFATIDLAANGKTIRSQLLRIVGQLIVVFSDRQNVDGFFSKQRVA